MSFKMLAAVLAEALIEDLQPFTPFTMAVLADYGKVGGYAPDYIEVKRDATAFLALCDTLGLRNAQPPFDLPELVADRLIKEDFFHAELDALQSALKQAASAIRTEDPRELERRARALDAGSRSLFDHLLHRGGIDPNELLSRPPGPFVGGEKIYVASRHSARLRDQICGYLSDRGLNPIVAAETRAGLLDADRAQRDMSECSGGVFGLTPPKHTAHGAIPLDHRLAVAIDEILLAETKLDRKLLILVQERMAEKLQDRLRDKPVFTMRDREMDEVEFSLFQSVASRTSWLAP